MKSLKANKISKVGVNDEFLSAEEDYSFREFIKMQQNYKDTFLARLYKGAEMAEIRKQLESGKITMKWYGQEFPKEILVIEHDIVQNSYYQLLMQEKQLEKQLLKEGLSKEELTNILKFNRLKKEYKGKKVPSYFG